MRFEPLKHYQELVRNLLAIGGQPQLLHISIGSWLAFGCDGFANPSSTAGKRACHIFDFAVLGELAVGRLVDVDTPGDHATRDVDDLDDACG